MSNKNKKLLSFKEMYEHTLVNSVNKTAGFLKANAINKLGTLQYNYAVEQ
jgi:hypothetical protein